MPQKIAAALNSSVLHIRKLRLWHNKTIVIQNHMLPDFEIHMQLLQEIFKNRW